MRMRFVAAMFLILLASSVSARVEKSRKFQLLYPVTLNGAVIPAGTYDLSFEDYHSMVNVALSQDGRFIAGAQGKWVKQGVKYTQDAALLRMNADGSHSLIEIRVAGTKQAIVFGDLVLPVLKAGKN